MAMSAYDAQLAAWPLPVSRHTVATAAGDTFVVEFGDPTAPPLILLHGSASNSASWGLDAPTFARAFHCFAVDLPGETGRSTGARPPYEGSAYVEWLADVLDALGLKCSRFCGLSLGGWAALRFAAGHPQRVVAAAVLAPGGVVPARESFTGSIDKTLASEAGMRRMAEAIFFPQPVPPGVPEAFALMQRIYKARKDDLPVITDSELLSITAPVLLLGGAHDALLDMRASETRLTALLPRLTSEIDEAAGHALIGKAAQVTDFFFHGAGARTDVPVPRTG